MGRLFLIFFLLACSVGANAFVNGNFEAGDLSGWTVSYGVPGYVSSNAWVEVPGPAPETNGNLDLVYEGNYACHLMSGNGGNLHTSFTRISQSDVISSSNPILEFWYAAVLDGTHALYPPDDAFFEVKILSGGTPIITRTYAYASSPAPLVDDGVFFKKHLPWTQIYIDLSAYVGQTVTVEFTAYECAQGGHYARAFIDGFGLVPPTATASPTATVTATPSPTPSFSASPSATMTFTASPTPSASPSFSASPSATITFTPSVTPSSTQTPTITPTYTATEPPLILKVLPPSPNPSTEDYIWLAYQVSTPCWVDIDIYTVAGERVRHLDEKWTQAGADEQKWDLRNDAGSQLSSGVFIYRVRAVSPRGEEQKGFSKCALTR